MSAPDGNFLPCAASWTTALAQRLSCFRITRGKAGAQKYLLGTLRTAHDVAASPVSDIGAEVITEAKTIGLPTTVLTCRFGKTVPILHRSSASHRTSAQRFVICTYLASTPSLWSAPCFTGVAQKDSKLIFKNASASRQIAIMLPTGR